MSDAYLSLPEPGGHKLGYARVSTRDQSTQLQEDALIRAGVDPRDIFKEVVSGAAKKRPELEAMLKDIRPGDIVIVWKMDRLGRDAMHLHEIAQEIQRKGAHLKFLDNSGLDTTTAAGRMLFGVLAHIAQFERDIIRERTVAGLAVAKAAGRVGGTRQRFTHEQILAAVEKAAGNLTKAAASLRYKTRNGTRSMTLPGLRKALVRAEEAQLQGVTNDV